MSDKLRPDLNKIKFEYCAVPLPVFEVNKFIGVKDAQEKITGAVVELHLNYTISA